jgi:alpha-tubulin suppressor-like RCC1 family protein
MAVSAGNLHTLGIKVGGTLWAWGRNAEGQLGQGDTATKTTIVQIGTAADWVSVSASRFYFSAAIKSDGTLWMWGSNSFYQLGLGHNTNTVYAPVQVGTATNWVKVSTGYRFTLAINSLGEVWAWGQNESGQLGQGDTTVRTTPTLVGGGYTDISAGYYHSLAIAGGNLYAWGEGSNSALGTGDTANKLVPTLISSGSWSTVNAGDFHSSATRGRQIFTWGAAANGKLGNGTTTPSVLVPTAITGVLWVSLATGEYHSLAEDDEGVLWAWGWNNAGGLGLGDTVDRTVPTRVPLGKTWGQLSCGDRHSMALVDVSSTFWRNFYGQSESP